MEKRSISAATAVRMLAEEGMKVSEKDAEIILDFLYFLAKLSVNQYLKDAEDGLGSAR